MSVERPEWGEVTVREDLDGEAVHLLALAVAFEAELRLWTHPARRADLGFMAERLRDFASWAHYVATRVDDPWTCREVLADALGLRAATLLTLDRTQRRRELEQGDTPRPETARAHLRAV